MPFIPLIESGRHRVSPDVQAARDEDARAVVASEIESPDYPPEVHAALRREYSQRFGGEPPIVGAGADQPVGKPQQGFTPLRAEPEPSGTVRGFVPIADATERPGVLRQVLLNNPATAAAETGLNLVTMGVAQPLAGLAGLATEVGRMLGLTERTGADVVHAVGNALTYQPRGEMGQAATAIATYPFEKLAEGGQYLGGKTLDATGSPAAATLVDTAINALPMVVAPAFNKARSKGKPGNAVEPTHSAEPAAQSGLPTGAPHGVGTQPARKGFTPLDETRIGSTPDEIHPQTGAQRLAGDARAVPEPQAQVLPEVRRGGNPDSSVVAGELRAVPEGYGAGTQPSALAGAAGRAGELRAGELLLDDAGRADAPARLVQEGDGLRADLDTGRGEPTPRTADTAGAGVEGEARFQPGRDGAFSEVAPQIGLVDLQRADAAAARVGTPDRSATQRAVEPAQARDVAGASVVPGAVSEPKGARYALIEADDIKASHDTELRPTTGYPADFARQQWERNESARKLQDIVHKFDPARLVAALDDAGGAPIVARDGVVEVGNTRAIALQRVYQANGAKAEAYRQALAEHAPALGIQPEAIRAMNKPVLVRIPDEPAPRTKTRGLTEHDQEIHNTQPEGFQRRSEDGAGRVENHQVDGATGTNANTARQQGRQADPFRSNGQADPVGPIQARGAPDAADLPADGRVNAWAPGANYVGFINDAAPRTSGTGAGTAMPEVLPATGRAKPIRREDVLIPFMKALDTGMYEGRIKTKGVMGFFRPKLEEVRIRRHADLETAAHELAHLIDYRVPEIRKTWSPGSGPDWKIRREELRGLSYDNGKVYEGFAEFVRHYMTQPDVAQTRAPTFYKWFEDFTQRHEYGPAIEQARQGMTSWFNQDAIDRARSKIGDHRPLSDALDGRWDAFRQATVDDLAGVRRMELALKDGKIIPNGPYESARLSRSSASIADGSLRYGAPVKNPDGSYGWTGKGLEEILRPIADSLDDGLMYFVGRSSRELLAQGREHLFTPGEIDGMLKLRRPEFDKAFNEYQAWNESVLDFAEAHGVINPAARAIWQRMEYMPFHRVGQAGGFKGKPGDWTGVKALTGGTENLRSILGNMTSNAAMLIDKAVKNEARTKIAELADQPGGGKFMVKIPPESRPVKIEKQAVIDAVLKSMGIEKGDPGAAKAAKRLTKLLENSPAMLEMVQNNMPPAGGNVVAVLKAGKPTWYEVADPLLLRALEAIDRQPPPWIVKWLGLPKRVGQATITLTPDFMIANMARDTIMGGVMSRAGFRPVIDSIKGMGLRLNKDPLYKDYIANGGGLSSIYLDEGKFKAKLEKFYGRQGVDYRTVLDSPDKLLGFVETLADAFETSTRLGEFKRAIDSGENPRHAAYLAREVSTDFAMRGDSKALGFMYDTVMFLKPALLSWDRLYRGLAHDPNKGAIATKAGMLALMSSALYLLNKDNAKYQDLPDWDRDANWHFFIGDQHFRYPKIWELGAMGSVAERATEKIVKENVDGLGKDFARILGATFNLNLMPQILAPLYEQGANRNGFTKAPIETPGMENLQPFMRAKPTTSETLKAAGMATRNLPESLQVNPVRAEALLRGYFNTYAVYGLMLSDQAFFGDQMPTRRTDQMPVVRRFYSGDPPLNTRFETEFYDLLGEATRLRGTLRELDKAGRKDIADEKERAPLASEASPLQHAAKNLQGINQEMRKVRRDQELTADDKLQRLNALTVERNDLLKRAVQDSKASLKEKTP